jgi:hypothetical protein
MYLMLRVFVIDGHASLYLTTLSLLYRFVNVLYIRTLFLLLKFLLRMVTPSPVLIRITLYSRF